MVKLRLIERIDGDWCAFVEGREDDAVVGPTGDSALGRLARESPGTFGIEAIDTTPLDPRLAGEPAARLREDERVIGPETGSTGFRVEASRAVAGPSEGPPIPAR